VERISSNSTKLIEKEVRTIHSLVMCGKSQPSRYRDGQNVIRDSRTNRIVYMPPEPKDVPAMMRELVRWINSSIVEDDIPVPVVAALAHYQFATIHPYFDGNGRTARLLTNLILHRNGYGLNGIYSLEEYYADNLSDYYSGLAVGNSHNYYFGRAEADVTSFVTYFCLGMAESFATVRSRAELASRHSTPEQSVVLRDLSAQQRRVLGLFFRMKEVTRNDVAKFFKLPARQAYLLCQRWLKSGFLVIGNPATKSRTYRLAKEYETLLVDSGHEIPGKRRLS
jgi:Fic family protein